MFSKVGLNEALYSLKWFIQSILCNKSNYKLTLDARDNNINGLVSYSYVTLVIVQSLNQMFHLGLILTCLKYQY